MKLSNDQEVLRASFVSANELMDRGQSREAYAMLLELAKHGYRYAFNSIGVLIENGVDPTADKNDAADWYRRAARRGDSCGAANLGATYLSQGKRTLAKKWLRRAMELGDMDSAVDLAQLIFESSSDHADKAAIEILSKAIASGQLIPAQKKLASNLIAKAARVRARKPGQPSN